LFAATRNLSRMGQSDQPTSQPNVWQRWIRQPQNIWLRRALFQVHLWSGIGIGLYVLMISVTGSVLIYSNELYMAATPKPIISTASVPRLTDDQLTEAALRAYPDFHVGDISRAQNLDQAVEITLRRGDQVKNRLFDPRTGNDLGDSVSFGISAVSELIDLHDNLLGGPTGRMVNGIGALAILALTATGLVVWWPGIKTWRRSLTLHRGVGWKRVIWDLHSMMGIWSLGFILVFVVSGVYLAFPDPFQNVAEGLEPFIGSMDRTIYWLAILHFGRINGIGFACKGHGVCDQTTKAIWAFFGLAPAAMFVTGAIMWWNRVLRPRWQTMARTAPSDAVTTIQS
jgi:uncharacterized iron-regulated membrane protein